MPKKRKPICMDIQLQSASFMLHEINSLGCSDSYESPKLHWTELQVT